MEPAEALQERQEPGSPACRTPSTRVHPRTGGATNVPWYRPSAQFAARAARGAARAASTTASCVLRIDRQPCRLVAEADWEVFEA